jgi:hypothetical protein
MPAAAGAALPAPAGGGAAPVEGGEAASVHWRTSLEIAAVLCGLVVAGFVLLVPECLHWYVIPVYFCGCVCGIDAVEWFRKRRRLFDPVGVVGVLGLHVFFLAPLLHVAWDYWMPFVIPPPDWRPWLGLMALINLAGIIVARFVVALLERRRVRPQPVTWVLDEGRFFPLILTGMAASVVAQWLVYHTYGGVNGYVEAFSSRFVRDEFRGMGWVFMISEAFPMLLMFGYVALARRSAALRSWTTVLAVMVLFVGLRVYFGGLRGSRAAYIWPLFWFVGLIHLWVRPIPRSFVIVGLVQVVLFMFAYGLYKGYGGDLVTALRRGEVSQLAEERKRGLDSTILGDLGRSDVQAYVLYRLASPTDRTVNYEYAFGRTYLGAAALMVPGRLWPDRPPPKTKEGTELFYGADTWNTRHFVATFAYGLAGETMLNFGPWGVPVAFVAFGAIVAGISRWLRGLGGDDSRMLIAPFIVSLAVFFLIWDSDVILIYGITSGLLPLVLIRMSSRVMPQAAVREVTT